MYKVCVNSARDLSVTSRDVLTSKACPDNGRTGFPSPFPTATPPSPRRTPDSPTLRFIRRQPFPAIDSA